MKEEILAHPDKSLETHLKKVAEINRLIIKNTPLTLPIDKKILEEISYLIGLYHDIGKATSFFQEYLKETDPAKKSWLKNRPETKHSLISAIAGYFAVEKYLEEINYKDENYREFLAISSYIVIKRHHTHLTNLLDDLRLDREEIEIIKKQRKSLFTDSLLFLPYLKEVLKKIDELPKSWKLTKLRLTEKIKKIGDNLLLYLIHHFLYSVLLEADKHDTVIGRIPKRKNIPEEIIEKYYNYKGFNNPNNPINKFRNEIYNEVIKQIDNLNLDDERILSLSAPTGSGKTLTSLAAALKLRNRIRKEKKYIPRIIYCLPFLSIIDQNAKVIEEIFEVVVKKPPTSDLFLIHHHLSDYIYTTSEENEYEPDESEILIEGWDSEIILTTFVQFFHTLFSNRNRAIRKFNKILGSIVILDEIQCFPHYYWVLFKEIALKMAQYSNTYFILSTATQPAIFDNSLELLKEKEKYFKSFQRTKIHINIKNKTTISDLAEKIIKNLENSPENTLIVLNTVRAAQDLFKKIKEKLIEKNFNFEVYFLSSHIVPYQRLERIEKIKNSGATKIVISTQLIEAGVDIDMERVIRDLSPMDSINQVAGRANRNWRRNIGDVEIIKLIDERNSRFFYSYIYDVVLIDATTKILSSFSIIDEKRFIELIENYYQDVKRRTSDDTSLKYLKDIKMLDYEEIGKFKLLEEEGEKIDIFIEINDEASKVWREYEKIIKIKDPFKRRGEFYKIRNKFYSFVISIFSQKIKGNLPPLVNGIRYVSKTQLEEFYDMDIGFKLDTDETQIIW
ncbi:MAG: CRISPR-associated helicase Cas3' [candidate division WOR-3 bacterium]|nr:CRISPR-associated helicase Cas3' [Candidatus Omnitrophota bacterium]